MSMDTAPENNLPAPDVAPYLHSGTGAPGSYQQAQGAVPWQPGDEPTEVAIRRLRDGTGDTAAEAALREQLRQAEDHNSELRGVLAQVRVQVQAAERAAINRLAQGTPDPRYWQGQHDAARAVWELVKPIV